MELQRRLQRDVHQVKVLKEGERVHLGKARDVPSHGGKSAKGPEEGQELKALRYGYNQGKNQDSNSNLKVFY